MIEVYRPQSTPSPALVDFWGVIEENSDPSEEEFADNRYRGVSNSCLPFALLSMFPTFTTHLDAFSGPFRYVDAACSACVEFCRVRLGEISRRGN